MPVKKQKSEAKRPRVRFQKNPPAKFTVRHNEWDWPRIKALIDSFSFLNTPETTTESFKRAVEEMYGYLPRAKGNLEKLIDAANECRLILTYKTKKEERETWKPYLQSLRLLVWAARTKWVSVVMQPNVREWDDEVYRFFLNVQKNLGKNRRVFSMDLTWKDRLDFKQLREVLRGFTNNSLRRLGFHCIYVIGYHPERRRHGHTSLNPPRLHVHLLIWSFESRSTQAENKALAELGRILDDGRHGIGQHEKPRLCENSRAFLKAVAYLAKNYHETMMLSRDNDWNLIPKGGRIMKCPPEVKPAVAWKKIKGLPKSPARIAWMEATRAYAKKHSLSMRGKQPWKWQAREEIAKLLKPETYLQPTVTGLDGITYAIEPDGTDLRDQFRLTNAKRGTFFVWGEALINLGLLGARPGMIRENEAFDPVNGRVVY